MYELSKTNKNKSSPDCNSTFHPTSSNMWLTESLPKKRNGVVLFLNLGYWHNRFIPKTITYKWLVYFIQIEIFFFTNQIHFGLLQLFNYLLVNIDNFVNLIQWIFYDIIFVWWDCKNLEYRKTLKKNKTLNIELYLASLHLAKFSSVNNITHPLTAKALEVIWYYNNDLSSFPNNVSKILTKQFLT